MGLLDLFKPFQSGSKSAGSIAMHGNRYPEAEEFLEAFSSVGEYDPDLVTYKYSIAARDGGAVELFFSLNDLSTTIFLQDHSGAKVTSFYSEFVDFIRIEKDKKQIFLSIKTSSDSTQSVIVRLGTVAQIEISALRK